MSKDKNMGLFIKVNTDEEDKVIALDKALKKLKRKMKKTNILIDSYNSYFYRKPSEIKREKKRKAISRNKRNIEMDTPS